MSLASDIAKAQLALIGNPENRRIQAFSDACMSLGHPRPRCLSYQDLLKNPSAIESLENTIVRIDSPGENESVSRQLIRLGGGPRDCELEFGEIAHLAQYHRGFCSLMNQLEESRLQFANSPSEIALMFDKWVCHKALKDGGCPRPLTWLCPPSIEELREQFPQKSGRLFLKPLHGSSASGVCALRWSGQKVVMFCPLKREGEKLFNCLQVQRIEQIQEVEYILNKLLPQGMIAEQWIPKLTLPGGAIDVRVLVINGKARHRIGRQSQSPMTNLHLGNKRVSEEILAEHLGQESWREVLSTAELAAACFPNSTSVGVDVLIDSSGRSWVGEVNAFGDLLPGLTHQDQSAYEAIAEALHA